MTGRNPNVFRWELLRAHPFAPCGVDNVSLTFCHLQARRLSGAGIHPSILFLENRLVSLEPEPLGSVCLGGAVRGQWAWGISPPGEGWEAQGWQDRAECVIKPMLSAVLCGFRDSRMAFPIYTFFHLEKKYILALPTWSRILFTLICYFICSLFAASHLFCMFSLLLHFLMKCDFPSFLAPSNHQQKPGMFFF